ncbi:hypothetical protein C0993_011293, partial [Termitomyces sp. T159_Od127]
LNDGIGKRKESLDVAQVHASLTVEERKDHGKGVEQPFLISEDRKIGLIFESLVGKSKWK